MHLFFLMLPHPLRTTLFPYTTLFRSKKIAALAVRLRAEESRETKNAYSIDLYPCVVVCAHRAHQRRPRQRAVGAEDRKSTRLNSSHVRISYAVFCLKKKKKIQSIHII